MPDALTTTIPSDPRAPKPAVVTWEAIDSTQIAAALERCGLRIELVPPGSKIPGSYWGESEAGIVGDRLFVRPDTPIHSALHEACHWICMDGDRRRQLDTDAGGDFAEEDAVCYLQCLLADEIPAFGRDRILADMDAWGYTFRLGSARAWLELDADDARDWLHRQGLIDDRDRPTWRART